MSAGEEPPKGVQAAQVGVLTTVLAAARRVRKREVAELVVLGCAAVAVRAVAAQVRGLAAGALPTSRAAFVPSIAREQAVEARFLVAPPEDQATVAVAVAAPLARPAIGRTTASA